MKNIFADSYRTRSPILSRVVAVASLVMLHVSCDGASTEANDAGVADAGVIICDDDAACQGGTGTGGQGGTGTGNGTPEQLCRASASAMCTNLGFPDNAYCYLVFAQDCSPSDAANAQWYCTLHPEIRHSTNPDGTCRPQW